MSQHVAVLMGGWSSEREVSLTSGAACSKALRNLNYRVSEIDVGRDLSKRLTELRPDIVFNALHGRWGEDGCVQGLLEILNIPYTHSGVLASAQAMNKHTSRLLYESAGIRVPGGGVYAVNDVLAGDVRVRPYVTKPVSEGSTVGVRIVHKDDNQPPLGEDWQFGTEVLVEDYVPGRELSVAVVDGKALGVLELRPKSGFYNYDAKYVEGLTEHLMPAPIPAAAYEQALRWAETAHSVLGCRGVSRSDFRYDDNAAAAAAGDDETAGLFILETNTQPGMTPLSIMPEIAAYTGMDFDSVVRWLVEDASCQR